MVHIHQGMLQSSHTSTRHSSESDIIGIIILCTCISPFITGTAQTLGVHFCYPLSHPVILNSNPLSISKNDPWSCLQSKIHQGQVNIYQSVMMLLRKQCYSCSKLMEKLHGLHRSPKGDWKLSLSRPGLLASQTGYLQRLPLAGSEYPHMGFCES